MIIGVSGHSGLIAAPLYALSTFLRFDPDDEVTLLIAADDVDSVFWRAVASNSNA